MQQLVWRPRTARGMATLLFALATTAMGCGEDPPAEKTPLTDTAVDVSVQADAGAAALDAGPTTVGCVGAADGTPCDDGQPCSADDRCAGGACKAGHNVCECQGDQGCAAYEDNDLCNGTLFCDMKVFPYRCRVNPITTVHCAGATGPCTRETCQPATGKCVAQPGPDGLPCLDDDPCTVESACKSGKCVGGDASWCACQADADCAKVGAADLCVGAWHCDKSVFPHACKVNSASAVDCSDAKDTPCTKNACQPDTGKCVPTAVEKLAKVCTGAGVAICRWVPLPKNAAGPTVGCDDGDACTQNETCADGQCVGGLDVCKCGKDADCDKQEDGDLCNGTLYCELTSGTCKLNPKTIVTCPSVGDTACLKNTCNPLTGTCAPTPLKPGTACDDGDACTSGEICKSGTCTAGTNICQCKSDADCESKDDGDKCNGTLFCDKQTGGCVANPASVVVCPTVNDTDCLVAKCVPKTGVCAPTAAADGKACDDGDKCTKGEICTGGKCGGGTAVCTCGSDADCAAEDDGDLCNGTLFCNKSLPIPTCEFNPASVVKCPTVDDTDCLKKTCVPQTGKCAFQPAKTGDPCSDGDGCTVGDWCLEGACKGGTDTCECHDNADCAAKDDGDKCNGTWFCDKSGKAPVCKPNPASKVWCSKDADTACLQASCDPKTGVCGLQPRPDGSTCPPGGPCVSKAVCLSGGCTPTVEVDCNDSDPCTIDTCDASGGCLNKAVPCDDGNDCTLDVCNSKTGACSSQAGPLQGKGCNADDNGCTVNDFCDAGVCVVGVQAVCPKATEPCTQGQCSSLSAQSYKCGLVSSVEGSPCVGEHACLLGSTCKAGTCVAGSKQKLFRRERTLSGQLVDHRAAAPHPGGGYVVVGSVRPAAAGAGASWLVDRLDATGEPVSPQPLLFASPEADVAAEAVDIAATDAGVVLTGTVRTKDTGRQVRVLALAPDTKTLLWDRTHGGAKDERAAALGALEGGGWLVAGRIGADSDSDGLALRLSATGLLLATWDQSEAGVQALLDGVGTTDGGALLVGHRAAPGGAQQGWLLRVDGGWKTAWSHALGDAKAQGLTSVARIGGTTIAAGWQGAPVPHAWWMDLDALGKIRWQQSTTLPSEVWSLAPLGGGGFALAGRMVAAVSSGWLAGIDKTGHLFWQREVSGGGEERFAGLVATADGGLVATGQATAKGVQSGLLLRTDPWGRAGCTAAGVCAGKSLTDCGDGKICTDDLCDATQGCAPAQNAIGCDDGDACTTADACQGGACLGGGKTVCDDANGCTLDTCDPTKGCLHTAAQNATCADDSVCTSDELCVGAVCQLKNLDCDDKQPCTVDACDPKLGCQHVPKPDETPCGGDKVCLLGTCTKRWAVAISAGNNHTAALGPDGKVRTWGYNAYGCLGRTGNDALPGEVPNLPTVAQVSAGHTFTCVASATGQLYCWGSGAFGIGCSVGFQSSAIPVVKCTDHVVGLVVNPNGQLRTCVLAKQGQVRCWGNNTLGGCGTGVDSYEICLPGDPVVDLNDAVQIETGYLGSCARTSTGKVRCWGPSTYGELGDGGAVGTVANHTNKPRDVLGLVDAIDVSMNHHFVCAVRAQGQVVCWGLNDSGQLGDGSLTDHNKPTPVFGISNGKDVDLGQAHACALLATGQVACWGKNDYGQLGNGNTLKSIAPLTVPDLDGVVAISAGGYHTCALRKNGEVRCWGSNAHGQLGDGKKSNNPVTSPVTVVGSAP